MKAPFYILLISLLCLSCNKIEDEYKTQGYEIDPNMYLFQEYSVPIKKGKITVVTKSNDTLAISDVPVNINIPKGTSVLSRAENNINVNYVDYKDIPMFKEGSYITSESGTLMFEDTEKADYDYNDLIITYKVQVYRAVLFEMYAFRIKPIALGSTKKLAFGVTDNNKQTEYLSKDVRKDWFMNKKGFINTNENEKFIPVIESNGEIETNDLFYIIRDPLYYYTAQDGGGFIEYDYKIGNILTFFRSGLKFFIEDEKGMKYYVAKRQLKLKGSLPYGLQIPEKIECYPNEKQNIHNVFPYFTDWINDQNKNVYWYESPAKDKGFLIDNPNFTYLSSFSWL